MTKLKSNNKATLEISTRSEPLRAPDHMEENPIGLPNESAQNLAKDLNRHQASMFTLFHQYQKHHWLVEGAQFRDLHIYFEESYNKVHLDLDAIAERLTVLGGIPTSSPVEQAKVSYITHEPEGYFPVRDMIKADLKAEELLCIQLRNTISRAGEINDYGTATLLKQVLMAAEDRAHHLDHYLAEDGLVK